MPSSFRFLPIYSIAGGLVLAGTLLSSCSSTPAGESASAPTSLLETTKPRSLGAAADSLNGMPGHPFGQPLSAFPKLLKVSDEGPGRVMYRFEGGDPNPRSWFTKHYADVPGQFYFFQDGKLVAFRAVAHSPVGMAALEQEARFLFGRGDEDGSRIDWTGQKVRVTLWNPFSEGRASKQLDVLSQADQADQARRKQEQLKAENGQ
ncbi:hypothetical protein [Hymenobacter psoromatis]|uniref:hypothetical protein n=1 Tax=Hymenobacter psoromatis TaxID=1484116 RepID=UPI001CBC4142|nr:hypothetical protein [Hymenobacter psoromatis]